MKSAFVILACGPAGFDQIAPIVWTLSEHGEEVHFLVERSLVGSDDVREEILRSLPGVTLHPVRLPTSRLGRMNWAAFRTRRLLKRLNAGLVGVEWWDGIADEGTSRSRARRLATYLSAPLPLQLQFAAAKLKLPTVSFPHGHSTKTSLVPSEHIRGVVSDHGGKLPFRNRDSFSAYIFGSEYHRRVIVENSEMSGKNTEVWGSARFSSEWIELLYSRTPQARIESGERRRVLMFLPKWHNSIDREGTMSLLRRLGEEGRLHVAIAGHLRAKDSALTELEIAELRSLPSLELVGTRWSSTSLISWCEVLIDVDSSIAFDAIRLGKLYVRPKYLQSDEVTTIYDQLGGAVQARDQAHVLEIVTRETLEAAPISDSFWPTVAGDGPESVSSRYAENLRRLLRA